MLPTRDAKPVVVLIVNSEEFGVYDVAYKTSFTSNMMPIIGPSMLEIAVTCVPTPVVTSIVQRSKLLTAQRVG